MIVAKDTFAVSAMFMLTKGLLARPRSEEDVKNLKTISLPKRIYPVSTIHATYAVRCAAPAKRAMSFNNSNEFDMYRDDVSLLLI